METYKQINSTLITYYNEGDFYEEELHIEINQPQFDELCRALSSNSVHVFIKD